MAVRTSGGVYNRRVKALEGLQKQKKRGVKQVFENGRLIGEVELSEKDLKRIEKEIGKLEERVK